MSPDAAFRENADVETIMRDLACPVCEYNLRGLTGPMVNCPECGTLCDVPRLIAARWTKPWWKAPGINVLQLPAAVFVVGWVGMACYAAATRENPFGVPFAIFALVYLASYAPVWQRFSSWPSIGWSLAMQFVIVAYLPGVILTVINILWVVFFFVDVAMNPKGPINLGSGLGSVFFLILGLTLILLAWYVEKRGAHWCIKQYLARRGVPTTD